MVTPTSHERRGHRGGDRDGDRETDTTMGTETLTAGCVPPRLHTLTRPHAHSHARLGSGQRRPGWPHADACWGCSVPVKCSWPHAPRSLLTDLQKGRLWPGAQSQRSCASSCTERPPRPVLMVTVGWRTHGDMLTLPGPLSRMRVTVQVVTGHLAQFPGWQVSGVPIARNTCVHRAHIL